jgi:hypothetical protein
MHQFRPSSNKLSISYTAHEATTQKTTAAYQTAMNPCPTTETECNESIASGEVTCSSAHRVAPRWDNGSRSSVLAHRPVPPRSTRTMEIWVKPLAYQELKS